MARRNPIEARGRGKGDRRENTRALRKTFLIICEGEKTEPLYFQAFPAARTVAEIVGIGDNTLSLVRRAVEKRDELAQRGRHFEQIWCVFDRDSFPAQQFNEAIRLANSEGMQVAYSNEAFELWYLLHFGYHQSSWTREALKRRLAELLPNGYEKNRADIYELLFDKQQDAIRNARRLLALYNPPNPQSDNPSTTVFELVELLNANGRGA